MGNRSEGKFRMQTRLISEAVCEILHKAHSGPRYTHMTTSSATHIKGEATTARNAKI